MRPDSEPEFDGDKGEIESHPDGKGAGVVRRRMVMMMVVGHGAMSNAAGIVPPELGLDPCPLEGQVKEIRQLDARPTSRMRPLPPCVAGEQDSAAMKNRPTLGAYQ